MRARQIVWLFLGLLGAGCGSGLDPPAGALSPRQLRRLTHTLVLTPVMGPDELDLPAEVARKIDSLVERELRGAGVRVVPAHEYTKRWNAAVERVGGLYDPYTGEPIDEKFESARWRLVDELERRFGADALLYPELWVVEAPHSSGVAQWDGASQAVSGLGARLLHAIDALLDLGEGSLREGFVAALSLVVIIEDLDGAEIYRQAGGIQVLERVADDEVIAVDPDDVLADWDRLQQAVRIAVGPLIASRR